MVEKRFPSLFFRGVTLPMNKEFGLTMYSLYVQDALNFILG
jgi:hypothetical protein